MTVRCVRCRQSINHEKSAYVATIQRGTSRELVHDVIKTKTLREDVVAMHLNGDRECGKEVSGYKAGLLRDLGMPPESDVSFLDNL